MLHPRIDEEMIRQGRHYPKMNGRHVFTFAVQKMPPVIHEALESSGVKLSDVNLIIPHQANKRITEQVARQLGVAQDMMFSNIEKLGNTTAASIPLAIYDAQRQGRLKRGDLLVLTSFGAGFTWAAAVCRW
jgi:3-oxoacyl-[acyl-carrier-protein] synthase-3